MGYISRKLLPACENVCLCCPALNPSSRRPVKRYKKLLSEIFAKTPNGVSDERKIIKLCEYAAKNPARIPKVARFLEQKFFKELQSERFNYMEVIMEVYCKLLSICKDQMAYFARNLFSVIIELLDTKQLEHLKILGCQTLTRLVYCQVDSTYACGIESIIPNVSRLARKDGEEHSNILKSASLQCLSSMVWFMSKYSYIFSDFDEIIFAILENYGIDDQPKDDDEGWEKHHNWVNEVIRSETRAGPLGHNDVSPNSVILRPILGMKDSSMLTREERENPAWWSQTCIQKLAELAKESTTLRRILDPMFTYFDAHKHWAPKHGLALNVLLYLTCSSKISGNEQFILISLVRHLDNKEIVHDPQLKSNIVRIATSLVKQLRLQSVVAEIGVMTNLCRHLSKSLQSTIDIIRAEEESCNFLLQDSIEDCLLEIVKGAEDTSPMYDMMTITLEKLSTSAVVARATIGSLLVLAHIISLMPVHSHSEQIFPEALLQQLLKAMVHPDVEARIGSHMIFSVLLTGTPIHPPRYESDCLYEYKKRNFRITSEFASATSLLEKLRREYGNGIKHGNDMRDVTGAKEMYKAEWKRGWIQKSSPCFHKLSYSIIDRSTISNYPHEAESNFMLSEDQVSQLLSAFWRQAHQPDNLPSNYEAIAVSFHLTFLSFHLKNPSHSLTVKFFQFLLSLLNSSLDPNEGLPSSSRISIFTLSAALLGFTGKLYEIPELIDELKQLLACHIDPHLRVGDDFLLYHKPSEADQDAPLISLAGMRKRMIERGPHFVDVIIQHLCRSINLNENELARLLSVTFVPDDDGFWSSLSPAPFLEWHVVGDIFEAPVSFDEDHSKCSSLDCGVADGSQSNDIHELHPLKSGTPSRQFMSVGQLLESALEVAGQVTGPSVSASPLPYGTMASQCEAFGMSTRKKFSTWLVSTQEAALQNTLHSPDNCNNSASGKVNIYGSEVAVMQPWRLPPASPFDNFMRAAGC